MNVECKHKADDKWWKCKLLWDDDDDDDVKAWKPVKLLNFIMI